MEIVPTGDTLVVSAKLDPADRGFLLAEEGTADHAADGNGDPHEPVRPRLPRPHYPRVSLPRPERGAISLPIPS